MKNRSEIIRTLTREEIDALDMGQLSVLANRLGISRNRHEGRGTEATREIIWRIILEWRKTP